jgi:chorismate-pyruvate lyase
MPSPRATPEPTPLPAAGASATPRRPGPGDAEATASDPRATVGQRLASVHFTAQEASNGLASVQITQLDAFLRALLFTDGTVSRTLEAHTLSHVSVEALEQEPCPLPAPIAGHLDVTPAEGCLRRRVIMRIARARPSVWAESYVVPRRLPREFLVRLSGDPRGIGGSLQQLKLESRRDLLWFGLGRRPDWAGADTPATPVLIRVYRVLIHGLPALLICESFSIEMHSGLYRMTGCGDTI